MKGWGLGIKMKQSKDIIKWGRIKAYFDKTYSFNTIDIETVDNELFIFGFTMNGKYEYRLDNFYHEFHMFLLRSVQSKKDVLTWSRYDNTLLVKLLLSPVSYDDELINKVLLRIGKVSPIYEWDYRGITYTLENIIKDSMIFKLTDHGGVNRRIVIYNLKNLYTSDLESTAENYHIEYYSKLGEEYHIIERERFNNDPEYRRLCLYSNELDNKVLLDIAKKFLDNFKSITGVYPRSIYTAGSIARSYVLANKKTIDVKQMNFKALINESKYKEKLLDYSMKAYHGGKIESYILGYVERAKFIDITSAYPYILANLPRLTGKVSIYTGIKCNELIEQYYYAFIRCNIYIESERFIHPLVVPSPLNKSNLSPYGYINDIVITKYEYDYLISHGISVEVLDFIGCESVEGDYPFRELVTYLFNKRLEYQEQGDEGLADLFKTIINSLYGITFELTDEYIEVDDEINWQGFRAGDFFNPILASYITAGIRTYLSDVSNNIVENGGEVYLNMTDSIIYDGDVTLDVFSDKKVLGKFDMPKRIKDVIILGAGRYEFMDDFTGKFTIKNRGFSVSVKDKSFYSDLELEYDEDLNTNVYKIDNRNFITTFKATTNKFSYKDLGHLIDDKYKIDPFNLGGKRIVVNKNVDLKREYTRTLPVYLDKYLYRNEKKEA